MKKMEMTVPSVLAFERRINASEAAFWQCDSTKPDERYPVMSIEKSVRGVVSHRVPSKIAADPVKMDAEIEKANLQTIDNAVLDCDKDTLIVTWTCAFLPLTGEPSSCNNQEFQTSVEGMVETYKDKDTLKELAKRYAVNIANARWLWRNRNGAVDCSVTVKKIGKKPAPPIEFKDVEETLLNDFAGKGKELQRLADWIEGGLRDKLCLLEIEARALIGKGQTVYPSQELILDDDKGGGKKKARKSRVLCVMPNGQVAMHSQKVGNAIRTIDTWYLSGHDDDEAIMPIAVESYGSVTRKNIALRNARQKKDFYSLFDSWALTGDRPEKLVDRHYVMAMLVRGGVMGMSAREK